MDPWFSLLSLTQSDHRGARDSVDFSVTSWSMPDLTSSLVRLRRLMMELQGIASLSLPGPGGPGWYWQ